MTTPTTAEIAAKARETTWGADRLARHFGLSRATCQRALKAARDAGELPPRAPGSNLAQAEGGQTLASDQPSVHIPPMADNDTPTMPDGDTDSVAPLVFDTMGRGLVMADIHCPYHDRQAVELAIAYAKRVGVTHCILLGDCTDFYQASNFCRTGRAKGIAEELMVSREMLAYLRSQLPQARIVYKVGNHELRLEHFVQSHAKELEGLEELELRGLLRLGNIGAEIVAENQLIYYGHLTLAHGHEFGKGAFSPVNPARTAFLKCRACVESAHQHQTSQHGAPDIRGELTTCWSLGCLCTLRPKYATVNVWNHGFAINELHRNSFNVRNLRILDGRVY